MTLVCDANVIIAALDLQDAQHSRCATLLEGGGTTIPAPAIVEIDWVTRTRGTAGAMDALLASIDRREVLVVNLDEEDYRRVRFLQHQYADLPLEFVDAAVVAIAERLEQTRVATLDRRHFSIIKPLHVPAFELVP